MKSLQEYWDAYNIRTDIRNPVDNEYKVVHHLQRRSERAYENQENNPLGWNIAHLMMQLRVSTYDLSFASGVHVETLKNFIDGQGSGWPQFRARLVAFLHPEAPHVPNDPEIRAHIKTFHDASRELLHGSDSAYVRWILELGNAVGREHFEKAAGTKIGHITHYAGQRGNLPEFGDFQRIATATAGDNLLWTDPLLEEARAAWYAESEKLGRPHLVCKFIAMFDHCFPGVARDKTLIKTLKIPGDKAYALLNYSHAPLSDMEYGLDVLQEQMGGSVFSPKERLQWEQERSVEQMLDPMQCMRDAMVARGLSNQVIGKILDLAPHQKYDVSRVIAGFTRKNVSHGELAAIVSSSMQEFGQWIEVLEMHSVRQRRRGGNYNPLHTTVLRDVHNISPKDIVRWPTAVLHQCELGSKTEVTLEDLEQEHATIAATKIRRAIARYGEVMGSVHPLAGSIDEMCEALKTPTQSRPRIERMTENATQFLVGKLPETKTLAAMRRWGATLREDCINDRQLRTLEKQTATPNIGYAFDGDPLPEPAIDISEFNILTRPEEMQYQQAMADERLAMLTALQALRADPSGLSDDVMQFLAAVPSDTCEAFWSYCKKGTGDLRRAVERLNADAAAPDAAQALVHSFQRYTDSKQALVRGNGRWALYLTNAILARVRDMTDDERADVRSAGFVGLSTAIDCMDVAYNTRVTTYSKKTIQGHVWNELSELGKVQYVPSHARIAAAKVRGEMQRAAAGGERITIEEANERAGTGQTVETVKLALNAARSMSLEAGNADGDNSSRSVMSGLTANTKAIGHEAITRDAIRLTLENVGELTTPQKAILLGEYAVHVDGAPESLLPGQMTLSEIGSALGISHSNMKQHKSLLLRRLRSARPQNNDDDD